MKPLLCLALCLPSLFAASPQEQVTASMQALSAAVLKNDRAVLQQLLADNIVYSHSNGLADDKAKAIAGIEQTRYTQYEFKPGQTFQVHGNTVLVRGPLVITGSPNGKQQTLSLSVLSVWVKSGKGWQLVARQSTRLP